MTDESLAPFHRNPRQFPRKQRQHNCSSKANRQLVKRNPPTSSGGIYLRIYSANTFTRNGNYSASLVFVYNRVPASAFLQPLATHPSVGQIASIRRLLQHAFPQRRRHALLLTLGPTTLARHLARQHHHPPALQSLQTTSTEGSTTTTTTSTTVAAPMSTAAIKLPPFQELSLNQPQQHQHNQPQTFPETSAPLSARPSPSLSPVGPIALPPQHSIALQLPPDASVSNERDKLLEKPSDSN
ncbi:unnamed protein product, partial [Protopolystoma xenopodis]